MDNDNLSSDDEGAVKAGAGSHSVKDAGKTRELKDHVIHETPSRKSKPQSLPKPVTKQYRGMPAAAAGYLYKSQLTPSSRFEAGKPLNRIVDKRYFRER